MGCWAIGCIGVIATLMMLCGGGFYGLFYSSIPLRLIEAAIEEDGEVEIEGLTGSLATGFSADEMRFKTIDDEWSNLTDIKFKYGGNASLFNSDRIIIEELSVNGGTIYADWDPEDSEFDFDGDFGGGFDEIGEEFEDIEDEFQNEFGRSPGIKEIRVDLVRIANLKIVNPTTELAITFDEVKFEGFQYLDGELKNLGELLVKSSQMELETFPSVEFAEMKNAERFEGVLKTQADHRLKEDMPFVVDFAVSDDFKFSVNAKIFGEQVQVVQTPEGSNLTYVNFDPNQFFKLENGQVLQQNVNFNVEYGEKVEKGPTAVNADGEFTLGATRFTDLSIEKPEDRSPYLVGHASVDGKPVVANVRIRSPYSPLWQVELESEEFESPEELWAQTLFNKAANDLSAEEQRSIESTMPERRNDDADESNDETEVTDEASTSEEASAEESSDESNDAESEEADSSDESAEESNEDGESQTNDANEDQILLLV